MIAQEFFLNYNMRQSLVYCFNRNIGFIIVQIENNTYEYDKEGGIQLINAGAYTYKNFFNEKVLLLNKENNISKTYLYEEYGFNN